MDPKIWGPIFWYIFHIISYSYIDSERNRYIKFFRSMPYILPCLVCTDHFKNTLDKHPPETNIVSRNSMIKWMNNIHNRVNKRLGKRLVSLKSSRSLYIGVNHHKIIKFLTISQKYLANGISSIIQFHGSNIFRNFCYIMPCNVCKEKMLTIANNSNLMNLSKQMIDIVSNCNKFISENNKYTLYKKFNNHQKTLVIKNGKLTKVICKQNESTPGVKKTISVKPNRSYMINIYGVDGNNLFLWIKDLRTNKITKFDKFMGNTYKNGLSKRIVIGVSTSKPKIGESFLIKHFTIKEI